MPQQPPPPPPDPQDNAPRQDPADAPPQPPDAEPKPLPFGERWRGKFVLAEVDGSDPLYAALVEKYLRL